MNLLYCIVCILTEPPGMLLRRHMAFTVVNGMAVCANHINASPVDERQLAAWKAIYGRPE